MKKQHFDAVGKLAICTNTAGWRARASGSYRNFYRGEVVTIVDRNLEHHSYVLLYKGQIFDVKEVYISSFERNFFRII